VATKPAVGMSALFLAAAVGAGCTVTTSGAQCDPATGAGGVCQSGQFCVAAEAGGGTCEPCPGGSCPQCNTCPANTLCAFDADGGASCQCGSNAGSIFYADANEGSLGSDPVRPTGIREPANCRFKSLDDALSAANARGPGSTAQAYQDPPLALMRFAAAAPLVIAPGVTLTSNGGATYYAVTAPSSTMPFLTVSAGSTLSGLQITSGGASGNAIQSDCSQGSGTVTIAGVVVRGSGPGTASNFATGVYHAGSCALDLEASTIEGVNESGVILSTTSTSNVTLRGNVISDNAATTTYLGAKRKGGGLLFNSEAPASLVVQGNQVYGNKGDQILVVPASGSVNLGGGACPSANIIGCYDSSGGVGIFANTLTVDASNDRWPDSPPQAGSDFIILGTSIVSPVCLPATTLACP